MNNSSSLQSPSSSSDNKSMLTSAQLEQVRKFTRTNKTTLCQFEDELTSFLDEESLCQGCSEDKNKAVYFWIEKETIKFEQEDENGEVVLLPEDRMIFTKLVCEQCQHDDPSYSSSLFSKQEVKQILALANDREEVHLNDDRFRRLIVKLICIQDERYFITNNHQLDIIKRLEIDEVKPKSFFSFKTPKFDLLVELLKTNFEAGEHQEDLSLIRKFLCYFQESDIESGIGTVLQYFTSIAAINSILNTERFRKLIAMKE